MSTAFILNCDVVETEESPGLLVLDFIRRRRRLTGTKEGCKEGDCGACMVLVGDLQDGRVRYRPMTSCLIPLGDLQGRHVVTIEGLNLDGLSPIQQAIVDTGASQCGYCTPGFVISLTGLMLDPTKSMEPAAIKMALGGNLCRCTGYRSLKEAGALARERLSGAFGDDRVTTLVAAGALPAYFLGIPARLAALPAPGSPDGEDHGAIAVAGGTDLYVQRGEALPDATVRLVGAGIRGVRRDGPVIHVGAATTFEAFGTDPEILRLIPRMPEFLLLMASWPIRNRATLAGNLVNASPIADMTSVLLALDATVILNDRDRERQVPLRSFYKGYKRTELAPGELVTAITFPDFAPGTRFNWEKLSKRTTLDIATVNSGCRIRCEGGVIQEVCISLGGVAPVPLHLRGVCEFLAGRALTVDTMLEALERAQAEFAPISDVRGSAAYRRLAARQLLIAHVLELFPDTFALEAFYEAC